MPSTDSVATSRSCRCKATGASRRGRRSRTLAPGCCRRRTCRRGIPRRFIPEGASSRERIFQRAGGRRGPSSSSARHGSTPTRRPTPETSLDMPGVVFRPHVFRPTFHKHAGETCGGVQVHVTNAASFRPYEAYLRLVKALHDLDPGRFRWRTEKYEYRDDVPAIDLLTGTATYRRLVGTGEPLDEWISSFPADVARFAPSRARSLLYHSKKFPVVVLVTGAHESGKTTVAVKLIEALVKEGLKVGSLKHTDHEL